MAILKAPPPRKGGSNLNWGLKDQPAEPGSYPGIILDALEAEGLEDKYNEGKTRDICRFLIAYRNDDDEICMAQTKEFTQSAYAESNLVIFLTSLLGRAPVFDNEYDYLDEVGRPCMVFISKETSKNGVVYPLVKSVGPISKKMLSECPDPDEVEVPGERRSPVKYQAEVIKPKKKSPPKAVEADEEDPF